MRLLSLRHFKRNGPGLRSGLIDFRLFHGPINLLRSDRERQTPESRRPNKTQIIPPQSGLVQQASGGNGGQRR